MATLNPEQAELLKAQAWSLHCRSYDYSMIAKHLGVDRKTVRKYVKAKMAENRADRQRQGYDDMEDMMGRERALQAEIWSSIEELDREIEAENEHLAEQNDAIAERNHQRDDGQLTTKYERTLGRAYYYKLAFILRNKSSAYAEIGRSNERIARAQGLISNHPNEANDLVNMLAQFDKRLQTKVTVELPSAEDVPLDWLPVEERKLIEERKPVDVEFESATERSDRILRELGSIPPENV